MQCFVRKYVFCFIISAFILSFLPAKMFVAAEEQSYLDTLPFNQPVGHDKGYEDFKGQKVVVVFGRITCGNTMYYVPYINSLIEQARLEDDLKVLFYDVDQAMSDVVTYVHEKGWQNIYTFSGGNQQMWEGLRLQGIGSSVTFPVVFYLDEEGFITHHSTNFQNEKEIKSNVMQTLEESGVNLDVDLNEVINIPILADAEEMSFDNRKAEITKRLASINQELVATYASEPNAKSPYFAGELTAHYQHNALAALNLARDLSGLSPVTLNQEFVNVAQHGAMLMSASSYSHHPGQPSNMDDAFYKKGYEGTSSGNIYYGYENLTSAIFHGWMADDDSGNIASVGHRRWALNPAMGATGFGEYNRLGVMYAFDKSNEAEADSFDAIAYPSGAAFPAELFHASYPWSIAINPARYTVTDVLSLKVTLENSHNKWIFTVADSNFNGNYMNYDTAGYGVASNIVFRPKGIHHYNGTYKVTVDGLKNTFGQKAILQYETTFYGEDRPVSSSQTPMERAYALSLVSDELNRSFEKVITRAEFSKLAVALYERLKGTITPTATFTDTNDLDVRKAATLGLVSGVGDGKFNPHGELTREHAAKIVDQLAQVLGLPSKETTLTYADTNKISDWAKPFVASVGENKLMMGDMNNLFNPKGKYTRKHSIVTLMRLYDAVKK